MRRKAIGDSSKPISPAGQAVFFLQGNHAISIYLFNVASQLGDFTLAGTTYFFRAPQESSENHLANISTRGFVQTGQGQLIGGFIITGGPKFVLVRAFGPSLSAQGVSPVLANPALSLMSGATVLRSARSDPDYLAALAAFKLDDGKKQCDF